MASIPANKTQESNIKPRPPIVVVVGHVDHGKTTLLDYIRKTNMAAREAGGITQATGAYEIVHTPTGGDAPRKITFIDTPGHEAFTAMRTRGANVADLAILVVAADEGVKPQTKEAIDILEESKTPFVVALNKIDKVSDSNLGRVKGDLAAAGVGLEGYGGQVSYHGVSAKTGEGVADLLDLVLLATDVENLTYDPAAPASGFILEVRRDPRRGIEAAVIIKDGVLHRGDSIKTQTTQGKVKILEDFAGKSAEQLEPSAPAIIIGLESLPEVGDTFTAGTLKEVEGMSAAAKSAIPVPAKDAGAAGRSTTKKEHMLNLILKSSDAGSLEALLVVLKGLPRPGGKEINIVDASVGDITDGDVKHAQATGATVIGFKNKVEKGAQNLAEAQSITVITSKIVYDLSKAVEDFLAGASGPVAAGELEVLAIFSQDKPEKQLVGGRVTKGVFRGKAPFEVIRAAGTAGEGSGLSGSGGNGAPAIPLGAGRVLGLREKKSEIAQAEKGKEIGVLVNTQVLLRVGDQLIIRK